MGLETRIEGVWWAKQSAKGTPASSAAKQGRKVGGDISPARADGAEPYSDGQRFPSASDYVDTILGNGNPIIHAQPGPLGHLLWLFSGAEAVTQPITGTWEHVITPNNAGSFWSTWWKKIGEAVGPLRQKFNDCKLVNVRIEGSSSAKVVRITPTFISLDSGEIFTSDPAQTLDTPEPFLYTHGEATFTVDGTVYRGHSSFAVVLGDSVTPWYGDSVVPYDVNFGAGQVMVENITLLIDSFGLQHYYKQIYGTTAPPAGTKPIKIIPPMGSYSFDLRKGNRYTITITGSPTGGTWTGTIDSIVSGAINHNANAAAVVAAFEAMPNVDAGDVTVTGGPGPGTPWVVTFGMKRPSTFTVQSSFTGGSSPAIGIVDNGALEEFKFELPGVKWTPDMAIAGSPEGGAAEITIGAEARKNGVNPMYRATVRNADAAYT